MSRNIPETVTDSSLEETELNIFKELDVSIDTSDIEACHCVGAPSKKKVIIEMPRRENAEKSINPYLLTIVCAAITNVYVPNVRDFGPISI